MNGISRLMVFRGRPDIAEPLYREALRIRCRLFGRDCPIRMTSLERLAELLMSQDRLSEAKPYLEDLVATRGRDGSLESRSGVRARGKLASCCQALEAQTP